MKTYMVYIYLKNGTEIVTETLANNINDIQFLREEFEGYGCIVIGDTLVSADVISHIIYKEEK